MHDKTRAGMWREPAIVLTGAGTSVTSGGKTMYRLQNLDKLAGLLREKYDDAGALLPKTKDKVIEHDR